MRFAGIADASPNARTGAVHAGWLHAEAGSTCPTSASKKTVIGLETSVPLRCMATHSAGSVPQDGPCDIEGLHPRWLGRTRRVGTCWHTRRADRVDRRIVRVHPSEEAGPRALARCLL